VAQLYPQALGSSDTSGGAIPCTHYCGPLRVLTQLQLECSLYNFSTGLIENTVSSSALIVAGMLASHCLVKVRLFIEPLPRKDNV
jgi:hypothetical protein